ncbi:hypothetical protein [Pseudorhodoferax sp. Leaf265]|uniref:hypothetical protein n=1 Tax=Pseudorhodoferax sp. Leaf265 TaxID=1736315 RepID=UPI0006FB3B21|nr:hypothetical protein [Pseudorhodoferax sp. Leaf265]KQP17523.1 hypothetical protein ASF45_26810 [Pseudorhodoferax sp. Leaf265]
MTLPDRPAEPTPSRPAHTDSALESLGKAITDPVRESAGDTDEATRQARARAQVRADAEAAREAEAEARERAEKERARVHKQPPPSPVQGR